MGDIGTSGKYEALKSGKYEAAVVHCTYNILFTNDICCGQVMESVEAMKKTPYYRHSFKKWLNEADRERVRYERAVNAAIGADLGYYFADCNERFGELAGRHLDVLYWQFKQALDDNGIGCSAEIARFELARTLCEYACKQHDKWMADLRIRRIRAKGFSAGYLRMTRVSRLMDMACESLEIRKPADMNTKGAQLAFDVLAKNLMDGGNIALAIDPEYDNAGSADSVETGLADSVEAAS